MNRLNQIIREVIIEATGDSSGGGAYSPPIRPGLRPWEKFSLDPFIQPVSDYKSPLVQYDSYDKTWDLRRDQIRDLERNAAKIQDFIKRNPVSTFSEKEGYIENNFFEKSNQASFKERMQPYSEKIPFNEWVEVSDNGILNEDLAVWFGTKKKPKGSKQPKGPWVNICRKVDGKHPPCGRPDTDKGGYPKCRAAGVAGKMSDSQKKSACQQKRRAEKKDTQTGKGQKPVMTSYKPKKESVDSLVGKVLFEIRNFL